VKKTKTAVIDERELWSGERFWVVIDETTGEDVQELYEDDGGDIETVRMWAVSNGYTKIEYT